MSGVEPMHGMWTTSKGECIPIVQMTDDHLRNAMAYLERTAADRWDRDVMAALGGVNPLLGEMARWQIEDSIGNPHEEGSDGFLPRVYWDLYDEAERRGLV